MSPVRLLAARHSLRPRQPQTRRQTISDQTSKQQRQQRERRSMTMRMPHGQQRHEGRAIALGATQTQTQTQTASRPPGDSRPQRVGVTRLHDFGGIRSPLLSTPLLCFYAPLTISLATAATRKRRLSQTILCSLCLLCWLAASAPAASSASRAGIAFPISLVRMQSISRRACVCR